MCPSHLLFPDPVCQWPGEYNFVAAILAAPLDHLPKLVYADWLEERGDGRSVFLRAWVAARQTASELPMPPETLSDCWLSVIGYTLDAWLTNHSNPPWADVVRGVAEPCVVVRTVPLEVGDAVPTGGSKTGGCPDLDPHTEWPEGVDGPAAFVAQWNLSELAVSPCWCQLPKAGLLSFFLDLVPVADDSSEGDAHVLFTADTSSVRPREPDYLHPVNSLPTCRVEFREWLSIPDHRAPVLQQSLPRDLRFRYSALCGSYPVPAGAHQILGHPVSIQSDPRPENDQRRWSLIAQFGQDGNLLFDTCDSGNWYFMVPTADMRQGRFGDTCADFQTG